jgi:adenylate cyclase
MSDVFISYARSTEPKARQIAEALRLLGYAVWRDDSLPAHRSYANVIQERLTAARAVVVIWSADAVRSEWVQSEADRARVGHKLVQLSLDGAPLPMPFDRIQCADLTAWDGEADAPGWLKVIESIASLTGGDGAASASRPEPVVRRTSVCVLPFANMSGDAEQEYFSDGISEDVITDLCKVSALSVATRSNAFAFKGRSVSVAEVARQLGVTHVLEGSVRKAGNRVRISVQLVGGFSDSPIWAERYDRGLDDIFAVQDEISQAIVAALKLKLLPGEKKAIGKRGTTSAEAYDLYLMARQYFVTGNPDMQAVARLCRRATEIDPGYARAWALMAGAQAALRQWQGESDVDPLPAIERALALDPDLAEAHSAKASYLAANGKFEEALAESDNAVRLDPGVLPGERRRREPQQLSGALPASRGVF